MIQTRQSSRDRFFGRESGVTTDYSSGAIVTRSPFSWSGWRRGCAAPRSDHQLSRTRHSHCNQHRDHRTSRPDRRPDPGRPTRQRRRHQPRCPSPQADLLDRPDPSGSHSPADHCFSSRPEAPRGWNEEGRTAHYRRHPGNPSLHTDEKSADRPERSPQDSERGITPRHHRPSRPVKINFGCTRTAIDRCPRTRPPTGG